MFSLFRFGWRTAEWTECRVDPLLSQQDKRRGNQTALCGGGIQTREAYCVQTNEHLLSHLNTHKDKEGTFCFLLKGHLWRQNMGWPCRDIYAAIWAWIAILPFTLWLISTMVNSNPNFGYKNLIRFHLWSVLIYWQVSH